MDELTEEELGLINFAVACYIDDAETRLKKLDKQGHDTSGAKAQLDRITYIAYTKLMPNSWSGSHPDGWIKYKEAKK